MKRNPGYVVITLRLIPFHCKKGENARLFLFLQACQ